jgi:uncharacterized UPF0160 family protein
MFVKSIYNPWPLWVQAIDADDNGIDIYEIKIDGVGFHTLSDIIESFVPDMSMMMIRYKGI